MLFPALFALGGAFFFFVLRVQGADGCFPKPLSPEKEAELLQKMQQDHDKKSPRAADRTQPASGRTHC